MKAFIVKFNLWKRVGAGRESDTTLDIIGLLRQGPWGPGLSSPIWYSSYLRGTVTLARVRSGLSLLQRWYTFAKAHYSLSGWKAPILLKTHLFVKKHFHWSSLTFIPNAAFSNKKATFFAKLHLLASAFSLGSDILHFFFSLENLGGLHSH